METELEIQKEVWESTIPIEFTLGPDPNELSGFSKKKTSAPLYIDAPRFIYAPVFLARLRDHFSEIKPTDEIWFEVNDVALKWHYPIGFLYDILGENSAPWQITVQYRAKTEIWKEIFRCPDEDTIKYHFKNMCKQAHCIQYGDIEAIHQLNVTESDQMWLAIRTNDRERYFKMYEKLHANPNVKNIPIRIYNSEERHRFVTMHAFPSKEGESLTTLGSFLKKAAPSFFPSDATEATLNSLRDRILIQGIRPPSFEMPLLWAMKFLGSPENFLYIVLQ